MKRIPTGSQRAMARRLTEVAFAVPQVVAYRASRMALAPTSRDRREMSLMVSEKAAAFSEAWMAMSAQAMRVGFALSTSFIRAPFASVSATRANAAMLSVLGAGLAPVHRRAVANAKRLARAR